MAVEIVLWPPLPDSKFVQHFYEKRVLGLAFRVFSLTFAKKMTASCG